MNSLLTAATGFFRIVEDEDNHGESFTQNCQNWANICRAPRRWLYEEFTGRGAIELSVNTERPDYVVAQFAEVEKPSQGLRKAARVVAGLGLFLFGELLALPLMGCAYLSKEIRLKQIGTLRTLSAEEIVELKKLVDDRRSLAAQRQGCDPVSCSIVSSLCSIVCLLMGDRRRQ